MTPPTVTSAPARLLSPAAQRIAHHLVDGLTPPDIATETGLSQVTVRQHIRDLRSKLSCPPRCKTSVVVHHLLTARQVPQPTTTRPVPDLDPAQRLLLRAVAENSDPHDIALVAQLAPADVQAARDALLHDTGAVNTTQLVIWAHAWGLLGARPTGTTGKAPLR
ncbi:helix-turn-helix transcriptional regulator [Streptomyces brevispora]|uniref:helix-turn-helix transcriptional regulator n=1 Tax=Streptomyces brevispora TaxID=887462 RepID=UPI0037F42BE5